MSNSKVSNMVQRSCRITPAITRISERGTTRMNDAEYADRAEDDVISSGQNETTSWEVTYDPEISWKNRVAVNPISDAHTTADHYRMHLRHYQEEVRDLKGEVESLKIQLKGSEDRAIKRALRHQSLNETRIYPSMDEIQERQARDEIDQLVDNRFYADVFRDPDYDGSHKKYLPGDCVWAVACGRAAVSGTETDVRVGVWQGGLPTGNTVNYKGMWITSSDVWELAKVQIISAKERHNEP